MGLEARRNGLYYYQKQRIGGRVVSQYIGSGPLAQLIALEALERREERAGAKAVRESQGALDRILARCELQMRAGVAAALRSAGFHNPKRQWRRKRG